MSDTVRTPLRVVPTDPAHTRGVLARNVIQRVNLWNVPTARTSPRQASATAVWLFGVMTYAQVMDGPTGVSLATENVREFFTADPGVRATISVAIRALQTAGVLVPLGNTPDRFRLAASLWSDDALFADADIARVVERVRATPSGPRGESVVLTVTLFQLVLDRLIDATGENRSRTIEWTHDEAARILGVRRAHTMIPALARLERARCLTVARRPGRPLRLSLPADEGHVLSPLQLSPADMVQPQATRLESGDGTELARGASPSRTTSELVAESIERAFALMQSGKISAAEYVEWKAKELARI